MGKERLHWGGGGSGSRKRGRSPKEERDVPSPGCMCAVFQFFDLHQFQFSLNHQPSFKPHSALPEEPTDVKGVVAPRNSLELEESFIEAASLPSTIKAAENLNIEMGIQIKTSGGTRLSRACGSTARADDLSSEYSSSAGAKTPNLVARLMGIDLLPDSSSPSSSSSNHSNPISKSNFHPQLQSLKHETGSPQLLRNRSSSIRTVLHHDITGTRSLPETPRISSAGRSDVEHHRLSLQISKENISASEGLEFSSYLKSKVATRRESSQEDGTRSPGHYARQIVKQVKENLSRKVGLDITNTIKNRRQGKEELAVLLRSKKPTMDLASVGGKSSTNKQSTSSWSQTLRFLESKNKPDAASACSKNKTSQSSKHLASPLSSSAGEKQQSAKVQPKPRHQELALKHQLQQKNSAQKCKKASNERYSPRFKKPPPSSDIIRNKQEEPFVHSTTNKANPLDNKSKKTPLTNDLLNINVPTLFPVKKDPSTPATNLPHIQESDTLVPRSIQLSSCSSHSYRQQTTRTPNIHGGNATPISGYGEEFQYISRILKGTGFDRDTPVSPTNWYSLSHPLDPSIFHHLELSYSTSTMCSDRDSTLVTQRCNRKLMFHLVDELLAEILRPYINLKPCVILFPFRKEFQICGSELINTLCSRIGSFPLADCRILEDIDALIGKDLCKTQIQGSTAYEEESEGIVMEIEREIVDALLHETAMVVRHVRYV